MMELCRRLNIQTRLNGKQRQPDPASLLLLFLFGFGLRFSFRFGYGVGLCSANFRKERLGYSRSRHFAQQQGPSCDLGSVYRVPRIIVLAD
jgi:hypothetical protein